MFYNGVWQSRKESKLVRKTMAHKKSLTPSEKNILHEILVHHNEILLPLHINLDITNEFVNALAKDVIASNICVENCHLL